MFPEEEMTNSSIFLISYISYSHNLFHSPFVFSWVEKINTLKQKGTHKVNWVAEKKLEAASFSEL